MKGNAASAIACIVLSMALEGCSDSGSAGAKPTICHADEAIACIAPTGCHGYKACNADGTAYLPCDCSLGVGGSTGAIVTSGGSTIGLPNRGGSAGAFSSASGGNPTAGASSTSTSSVGGSANLGGMVSATGGASSSGAGVLAGNNSSSGSANAGANSAGGAGSLAGTSSAAGTNSFAGLGNQAGANSAGGAGSLAGTSPRGGAGNAGTNSYAGLGNQAGVANSRRPKVCDSQGNCRCHNVALLGTPAKNSEGTTSAHSFSLWLQEKSNANVQVLKDPQHLSRDLLRALDVVILQDLRSWTLTSEDAATFAEWVQAGGGVIGLSGYMNNDDAEVTATNALIGFTGMRIDGGGIAGSVPGNVCPESSRQLCPQSTSACCYCWGNSIPITAWAATHPISKGITAVPAFMGRSVKAAAGGAAIASFESKTVAAIAPSGLGLVFLFGDDAVTYRGQWSAGYATGTPSPFEACYVANTTPPHWVTADQVFQTKQLWFNAIRYVAPTTECNFVIAEPEIQLW